MRQPKLIFHVRQVTAFRALGRNKRPSLFPLARTCSNSYTRSLIGITLLPSGVLLCGTKMVRFFQSRFSCGFGKVLGAHCADSPFAAKVLARPKPAKCASGQQAVDESIDDF